jgi:hypothetical protein
MADGEWLLFSDADVHFQKQSLRRAITYCHENQLDFLAVGPTLHGATLPLKIFIAQFLHLMGFGYSASRIRDPERVDVAGTGAFNLVRRPVLEGVGRFNDLKMEVLDDGGLGWIIKRAGGRVDLLGGVGEISVDWYPNLFAFVRGIEKNGFAFFQYSLPAVLIYAAGSWIIVLVTLVLPSFSELAIVSWICFVIYLLASAWSFKRTFGISPWMAFTLPVSFLLLPFIPLRAAILCLYRGGVHWRGTFYRLTELRKHQRVKVCDMIWKRK